MGGQADPVQDVVVVLRLHGHQDELPQRAFGGRVQHGVQAGVQTHNVPETHSGHRAQRSNVFTTHDGHIIDPQRPLNT